MNTNRVPTERDMLAALREGQVDLRPFTIRNVTMSKRIANQELDGVLDLEWKRERFRFAVECKALSTPKAVEASCDTANRNAKKIKAEPLLFIPYLSRATLARLQDRNVSGIDLCGNVWISIPGKIYVERTGNPNQFPQSGEIKNVYRKASSIVARTFLLVPDFRSLGNALAEISNRGGEVTLATVSKVCKQMEADLVIERFRDESSQNRRLRLLQAEKLLGLLEQNYLSPIITKSVSLRLAKPFDDLAEKLERWNKSASKRIVQTGESSVDRYAVMAREPKVTAYCTSIDEVAELLGSNAKPDDRFPNCTLLQTSESQVYFDTREGLVASPVQTYLELMTGDKRSKETAEQVRNSILSALKTRESTDVPIRSAKRKSR